MTDGNSPLAKNALDGSVAEMQFPLPYFLRGGNSFSPIQGQGKFSGEEWGNLGEIRAARTRPSRPHPARPTTRRHNTPAIVSTAAKGNYSKRQPA